MIKWLAPQPGWFKLNTDGASHGNPGLAAAGGVVRNEAGDWVGGFALNIVDARLHWRSFGEFIMVYISLGRKELRLVLEVDLELAVGYLMTGIGEAHPLSFLVRLCHGFLLRDWIVRVSHVYREANRLANGLANYVFSLPLGFHSFDVVLVEVSMIMR